MAGPPSEGTSCQLAECPLLNQGPPWDPLWPGASGHREARAVWETAVAWPQTRRERCRGHGLGHRDQAPSRRVAWVPELQQHPDADTAPSPGPRTPAQPHLGTGDLTCFSLWTSLFCFLTWNTIFLTPQRTAVGLTRESGWWAHGPVSVSWWHCVPYTGTLTAFEGVGPGPHGTDSHVGRIVARTPCQTVQASVDFAKIPQLTWYELGTHVSSQGRYLAYLSVLRGLPENLNWKHSVAACYPGAQGSVWACYVDMRPLLN